MIKLFSTISLYITLLSVAIASQVEGGSKIEFDKAVKFASVLKKSVTQPISIQCSVDSFSKYMMSSHVAGALKWLAQPGMEIKKGELAALQNSYFLETEKKQIELAVEKLNLLAIHNNKQIARLESLKHEGHVAVSELDNFLHEKRIIKNDLQLERVKFEEVSEQIKRTRHEASFDAVVSRRFADEGQYLTVGDPILELVSYNDKEIRCDIPMEFVDSVKPNKDVTVLVNGSAINARIVRVLKWSARSNQSFSIYFVPGSKPIAHAKHNQLVSEHVSGTPHFEHDNLLLGTQVTLSFDLISLEGLLIPYDALLFANGTAVSKAALSANKYAGSNNLHYVIAKSHDSQQLRKVHVKVVASTPEYLIVDGKISTSDEVVIRGATKLAKKLDTASK